MCKYCDEESNLAFFKSPVEVMGNNAERYTLCGVEANGTLHIERRTVRKKTMDIDFLGKGIINFCPMCGRKFKEEQK